MINFAKPNKVDSSGTVPVNGCRPITVMALFWRIWGSAWMQTASCQAWIQSLPDVIVGGKHSEAQVTAAAIFAKLSTFHCGATLDFTKCYDLMQPSGTTRLLAAGGPTGITNLIHTVWSSQKRWVCWESHTGAQPLQADS